MNSVARPKPRKWIPRNPDKYIGNVNDIVSRSSWETRCMNWFDLTPAVVKWNSEDLVIPYINPMDNKPHRYFVDFVAQIQDKSGSVKVYAIEVKPFFETLPPVPTSNKKRLLLETQTYITNQSKWKAAKEFCSSKGIHFIVLTEKDLGI